MALTRTLTKIRFLNYLPQNILNACRKNPGIDNPNCAANFLIVHYLLIITDALAMSDSRHCLKKPASTYFCFNA